jgi:hypothetical protein
MHSPLFRQERPPDRLMDRCQQGCKNATRLDSRVS